MNSDSNDGKCNTGGEGLIKTVVSNNGWFDYIEGKILQIRKHEKVMKKQESLRDYQGDIDKYFPEKPVTNVTNVYTQNYFHNQDSKIENQAHTINEGPAPAVVESPKKTNWLQIIAWVVGIAAGLASLLKIFIM